MPAKNQDEYLPSGTLIYVAAPEDAVWNDGYVCWFASPAKRRQYVATRADDKLLFSLRAGHSSDRATNVWLLFDKANGHGGTKRYVWIFPTKADAVEHRRCQTRAEGALLSEPQRWHNV